MNPHRLALAKAALERLDHESPCVFRNERIRSDVPDMYSVAFDVQGVVVVPFHKWSARCTREEVSAILEYWQEVGTLLAPTSLSWFSAFNTIRHWETEVSR